MNEYEFKNHDYTCNSHIEHDCDCEESRSPAGSIPAEAIADAILGNYAVLAHDGNMLKGEHYWVKRDELIETIEAEIGD